MKVFYILLVVLLLVGGYYFVAGPPTQVPDEEQATTMDETTDEESLSASDDVEPATEAPVEEPADSDADMVSAESATDAGMEFPIPDEDVVLETKTFDVVGFNYGYDVSEIRVQEGDTVTINFSVREGFHDWVVDEFGAATEQIRPDGLATVTFVADKAGTYEYYCSVGSHRAQGMVGTLIVE